MASIQYSAGRGFARVLALLTVGVFGSTLIAQQPGFRPPLIPMPGNSMPGFNPNPAGSIPNMRPILPPVTEIVWKCNRCGRIVSTGPIAPVGSHCPGCGVLFVSADYSGAGFPPLGSMPGFVPPTNSSMPPNTMPASSSSSAPGSSSPSSTSPTFGSSAGGMGTVVLGVIIIVVGVVVLGGAACLIVFSMSRRSAPPRRRRRFDEDDDYDD